MNMHMNRGRKTIYRGITMRSRREAGFAAWLDANGLTWEYEPKCFAAQGGQYLPDFFLPRLEVSLWGEPIPTYIEVKPPLALDDVTPALQRMMVIHESEPDVFLMLVGAHRPGLAVCVLPGHPRPAYCEWVLGRDTPPAVAIHFLEGMEYPFAGRYWEGPG